MAYVRWEQVYSSGKVFGLFAGGFDTSCLSDEEAEEFRSPSECLRRPPEDILSRADCIYAFVSEEAEARCERVIALRRRCSIGNPRRVVLDPNDFIVVWEDDVQVALIPRNSLVSAPHDSMALELT